MGSTSLVVVGASLAGLRAVEAARKAGFDGDVTLVGAEEHLPYDRPPLSKAYLDAVDGPPAVPTFRDEQVLREELDVALALGTPATSLDVDAGNVCVGERRIPYDALVIATGAEARQLPGSRLKGVQTLRTLDDARAVRAALDARARTVVIGAGFIGSEVASGARKRGLDVAIVEALHTPLVRAIGRVMGETCAALHTDNGTNLRCGVTVDGFLGDDRVEGVRLSDGTVLPADLVVVGVGAVPAVQWLAGSGLTVDNGVVCDDKLWTGAPGIYAAGDVARWHNPRFGRSMRLEHWTSAAEQGARAALNAIDPSNAKPYETVPYFWSDWYSDRIQFVGVPGADEVSTVDGDLRAERRCVALYREGSQLVGALTINAPTEIMKYRGLIAKRTSWADAHDFAAKRRAARVAKAGRPLTAAVR